MLNVLDVLPGWSYPTITQAEYDERRPRQSMTGPVLAQKYGGWKRACKAAYGLRADGRTRGRSHHAWPAAGRGESRVRPYTHEEVIRAVRACALELARRPSSSTYVRWSAAKRRLARVNNTARIPTIGAVYRHFPAGTKGERWRRSSRPRPLLMTSCAIPTRRAQRSSGSEAKPPSSEGCAGAGTPRPRASGATFSYLSSARPVGEKPHKQAARGRGDLRFSYLSPAAHATRRHADQAGTLSRQLS